MSKRVSASALALPIDGPDLDHVAKPLIFLDGSDLSHPPTPLKRVASNLRSRQGAQNLHASTDFVPAPAASKGMQASDINLANAVTGGEPENGSPHQPTNHVTDFLSVAQSQSSPTKSVGLVEVTPENGVTKRTKSIPSITRFTTKHVETIIDPTSQPEIDIPTSADPAPQRGALQCDMVERVKAQRRTASGRQIPSVAAFEVKASTKSASPVLAKAQPPQAVALKPSHGKRNLVEKPASVLPDLPEIYGMRTEGDCMVPEILDGQKIIVSKSEEVKRGDTVCLWLKSPSRPEGYSALVKKVAMLPPPHVTFPFVEHPESEIEALVFVEQINPPRTYHFKCEDVLAMHKVIGVQSDREG